MCNRKLNILILLFFILNQGYATTFQLDNQTVFEGYETCFILYDLESQNIVLQHNMENQCEHHFSPNSTFKVALALIAVELDLLDEKRVIPWNGSKNKHFAAWNQDQTLFSWIQHSVLWVSRELSFQMGEATLKQQLKKLNYGNHNISGKNALTQAWLSNGSLKISPVEQLTFLNKMLTYQLPVKKESVDLVKQSMFQADLNKGTAIYYGKTGSGSQQIKHAQQPALKLREGWFIGFVEYQTKTFIFVTHIVDKMPSDSKKYAGLVAKAMTLEILEDYFKSLDH